MTDRHFTIYYVCHIEKNTLGWIVCLFVLFAVLTINWLHDGAEKLLGTMTHGSAVYDTTVNYDELNRS